MTLPANIRVNVRVPFPAQVSGSAFINVAKANGVWSITPSYQSLIANSVIKPTQILALQDTLSGVWSQVSAAGFAASSINAYRIVTSAGAVSVLSTDVVILLQKSPSGPSTINLPLSSSRNGALLIVKDVTGDASINPITFVPAASETIDGLSASAAVANGAALINTNYGDKILLPLTSGGWSVIYQGSVPPLAEIAAAPNLANVQIGVLDTLVTLSGASTNASVQIPANCIVLAVGSRVVTAITGATSYEVGVSGNLAQFGSGLAVAAGSTNYGLIGPTAFYSATTLIVTSSGGNFTGGQVRLSICYMNCNPSLQ